MNMKKLIIILLLSCSVLSQAQYNPYTKKDYRNEVIKSLAINTAIIALDAVGDGLLDEGRQTGNQNMMVYGHALQAASVGVLLSKPLIQNLDKRGWALDITSFVFIRAALFDPMYNTTRGLPITYVGDTSAWDKAIGATKSPPAWNIAGRSWCLLIGVMIPINEF